MQVWIMVGIGAALVAGEATWAALQWRKERRAAGSMREALLGATQAYLEP